MSGGKTYYLRYTDIRSKTRYLKLADAADVTLAQGRKLCEQARNKIAMGEDPQAEKALKREVPVFREFAQERYLPYVKTYKASWKTDECLLRVHLIPVFGSNHLDKIMKDYVIKFCQVALKSGANLETVNRRLIQMREAFEDMSFQLEELQQADEEREDAEAEREAIADAELAAIMREIAGSLRGQAEDGMNFKPGWNN